MSEITESSFASSSYPSDSQDSLIERLRAFASSSPPPTQRSNKVVHQSVRGPNNVLSVIGLHKQAYRKNTPKTPEEQDVPNIDPRGKERSQHCSSPLLSEYTSSFSHSRSSTLSNRPDPFPLSSLNHSNIHSSSSAHSVRTHSSKPRHGEVGEHSPVVRQEKARPFECEVCGQRFIKKDHAVKHWRVVHLKQRPFKCMSCGSSFGQRSDLNKHVQSVHLLIKPHECRFCGRPFSHKGNLSRHEASVHGNKK